MLHVVGSSVLYRYFVIRGSVDRPWDRLRSGTACRCWSVVVASPPCLIHTPLPGTVPTPFPLLLSSSSLWCFVCCEGSELQYTGTEIDQITLVTTAPNLLHTPSCELVYNTIKSHGEQRLPPVASAATRSFGGSLSCELAAGANVADG